MSKGTMIPASATPFLFRAEQHRFFSKAISTLIFVICVNQLSAQTPDWKKITGPRDQLTAIISYAKAQLKQQKPDAVINTLYDGLAISKKASLDSFEAAANGLLGQAFLFKSNYDSAGYFLRQGSAIAAKNKYVVLQANIYLSFFGIYSRLGKTDSTSALVDRFQALLPVIDSNGAERAKFEMYFGHYARRQAKYSEALQHYFKSLSVFNTLKDSANAANLNSAIANVYSNMEQPDKALAYYREAIGILRNVNARYSLSVALLNVVDLFYNTNRLDSAERYVKEAMDTVTSMNERSLISHCYLMLGNIYRLKKNYNQSEAFFLHCIQLSEELKLDFDLLNSYKGLGLLYMAKNNPVKAETYLQKSLVIAQANRNNEMLLELYGYLATNAGDQHNYAKAFEYQKQYTAIKDSIYSASVSKSMAEMESKYQNEKKEQEIILLKKDQQLRKAALQRQRAIQAGSFIFIGLIVIIGFLAINRYRIVQRSKRLIEMEKMRNDIARDLHDDIGSTLSSIHIKSQMALSHAKEEPLVISQLQKIREHSGKMMESMGDIVWAINPGNDSLENLVIKMKTFAAEILEPLNIEYSFREPADLKTLTIDVSRRKEMYLIFKEAINNAAKYSKCTNIITEIAGNQQQLILTIKDNGRGFNSAGVQSGNGLTNMRSRAKTIGAQFDLVSTPGNGTTVMLTMPVT